jgi:hypothetical protein
VLGTAGSQRFFNKLLIPYSISVLIASIAFLAHWRVGIITGLILIAPAYWGLICGPNESHGRKLLTGPFTEGFASGIVHIG